MRVRPTIYAAAALLALLFAVEPASAAELGTPPHFLMLADRERIVLFSDGPIAGALADHRADGSIVVTVPKVAAGATIVGREFDDAASGGTGGTKVRVSSSTQGDARIEISAAGPIERVHAYGTTKPARLTIDLLRPGAKERVAERAAASAKEPAAGAAAVAAKERVAKDAAAPAEAAATTTDATARTETAAAGVAKAEKGALPTMQRGSASPGASAPAAAGAPRVGSAAPPVSAAPAATAVAAAAATEHGAPPAATATEHGAPPAAAATEQDAPAVVALAGKDAAPPEADESRDLPGVSQTAPVQPPAPTPTASPAASANDKRRKSGKGGVANENVASTSLPASSPGVQAAATGGTSAPATGAPQAVTATASITTSAATAAPVSGTLVCRWRRVAGIPYCGPDPKDGIYAADLGTAEIAGLLDRARSGPTVVRLPDHGPAEAYLNADVALVRAAKSGYLLPVLAEYEHALRSYPNFRDAGRARANVTLIYHSLGFAPELERLSRAKNDDVAPFAAVLLADLWRDREEQHDVAPLLARGRNAGGITRCLAERVAASVAADQGRAAAFPGAFAELSQVCPRTVLEDSETAWLRGRAMLLGGEAGRAADVLPVLEEELPRRERPLLLADVVAAKDAAGDAKAARATQERLAGGTLGRRAAREARLALAARDAAEGRLGDLATRFADMPLEDAVQSRARADAIAVGELLRAGNEIAALGMMTERKVEVRNLAPADQLLLAHALRKVGLLDQARRVLAAVGAATTGRLPDGYYEELGALALAHDDARGALEVADDWRTARGGNPPPGAIALKARARAAKGDARGAVETLERELVPLDPVLARDVAVDLAGELRSADPALALRLAQGALVDGALPALEPAREAEALSALADAAEGSGDKAAAQLAFSRLASEFAGEPAAAGAAYRAARLAAAAPTVPGAGAAVAPTQPAATAPQPAPEDDDPLSRRIAAAGRLYQEVVSGMQGARP